MLYEDPMVLNIGADSYRKKSYKLKWLNFDNSRETNRTSA